MSAGFYLMHRGWMSHPLFKPEPYTEREAWLWLIERAAFRAGRMRVKSFVVEVARGEVAASTRQMAEAWQWLEPRVRRFLERLKIDAMIDARSDSGVTVIRVCNYDTYQASSHDADAPIDAPIDAVATHHRRSSDAPKEKEGKEGEQGKEQIPEPCSGVGAPGGDLFADTPPPDIDAAVQAYIAMASQLGLALVRLPLHPDRRKKLARRLGDVGPSGWATAMAKVRDSPFLRGDTKRFTASFDWLIEPANLRKVLEGNYDDRKPATPAKSAAINKLAELRASSLGHSGLVVAGERAAAPGAAEPGAPGFGPAIDCAGHA